MMTALVWAVEEVIAVMSVQDTLSRLTVLTGGVFGQSVFVNEAAIFLFCNWSQNMGISYVAAFRAFVLGHRGQASKVGDASIHAVSTTVLKQRTALNLGNHSCRICGWMHYQAPKLAAHQSRHRHSCSRSEREMAWH